MSRKCCELTAREVAKRVREEVVLEQLHELLEDSDPQDRKRLAGEVRDVVRELMPQTGFADALLSSYGKRLGDEWDKSGSNVVSMRMRRDRTAQALQDLLRSPRQVNVVLADMKSRGISNSETYNAARELGVEMRNGTWKLR